MPRLNVPTALLAVLAGSVLGFSSPASAQGNSSQVLSDCSSNGHLTGTYSRGALQGALSSMAADTKEYTSCYDVIHRALLVSAAGAGHRPGGGSGSGAGGSGAGSAHPGSQPGSRGSALNAAASTRGVYSAPPNAVNQGPGSSGAVALGGANIRPGGAGISGGSGVRSLPGPMIAALVLLGLAAIGGGAVAIRRRVVSRYSA